ncbi:hypothetical protein L7F22_012517 [Adiantum nelumboides]|nr:hypothetical protein [Adiantum nelumboides]
MGKERVLRSNEVLFAGFETTSTTLAWTLWRLSRDQALQERVRRQIKDYLVQRDVRTVSEVQYEDVWSPELDLIGRVVLETLRLHPPVPTMERVSTRDTVLKLSADADLLGSTLAIGKGTKVVLGLAALSCDSEYFGANPLDFNPDRFLHLPDKHRDARFGPQGTFTFSGGPKAW